MRWNGSGSEEEIAEHAGRRVYTIGASQVASGDDTSTREIHDTNRTAPERVHHMKHESRKTGKIGRETEEERDRREGVGATGGSGDHRN